MLPARTPDRCQPPETMSTKSLPSFVRAVMASWPLEHGVEGEAPCIDVRRELSGFGRGWSLVEGPPRGGSARLRTVSTTPAGSRPRIAGSGCFACGAAPAWMLTSSGTGLGISAIRNGAQGGSRRLPAWLRHGSLVVPFGGCAKRGPQSGIFGLERSEPVV